MVFFQQPARIALATVVCVFGLFATQIFSQTNILRQTVLGVSPAGTSPSVLFQDASSRIGIATTTPTAGLHINNNSMLLSNPTYPGRTYSIMTNGTQQVVATNDLTTLTGGNKGFAVGTNSTNNNFFVSGGNIGNIRFIVNGGTGNVGIGTSTPNARLEVNSGTAGVSGLRFTNLNLGSTAAAANNRALSLDAAGNVILVNNPAAPAALWTASGANIFNANTGNIGVGTTTPASKLTVSGAEGRLLVNGATGSDLVDFVNTAPANTVGNGSSVLWAAYNQAQSSNPMLIQATGNNGCTGCYQDRFVVRNAGNVGIENSDPKERLQIGDRFTFHNGGNKYIGYNATWNGSADVRLVADEAARIMLGGDGTIQLETGVVGAAGTAIAWTPSLKVNNDGKVTIGSNVTTPGTYKLYVEQGILTEKVKVAVKNSANWADYVFADNYSLSKLTDVEAFVKQNKHLPNMPSAEDMVKNGLDVATMDAKLLEKIEELTLYMIQMQKENIRLQKEMDGLKTTITSLQKQ